MKKDIFIDTNLAKNFSNPIDKEYIKLIQWLLKFDDSDRENIHHYAHLVTSQKLLNEYKNSAQHADSETSMPLIVAQLWAEGRLNEISKKQIEQFKAKHFSKKNEGNLTCNNKDRQHMPVVLLSDRQYALSYDKNFTNDLINFPGFNARVEKRPENLPYSE